MLDAAPVGLLRVNRGTDANWLTDLLTFMSNAIIKSSKQIFGAELHELRQIVKGLKNNKAVGNDGIPSEVYKFASERLLTMMSIFLSGCMLTGQLQSTLMHVVIIPLLKCKSKYPADVHNYRPIAIVTALSKVLEQAMLSRLARHLWTADSQFGFQQAQGAEMAIFALKQLIFTVIRTHLYKCAF